MFFVGRSTWTREHPNPAKHSKQRLLEQIQSGHRFHERDRAQEPDANCCDAEWPPPQLQYYGHDTDLRKHKPAGLGRFLGYL